MTPAERRLLERSRKVIYERRPEGSVRSNEEVSLLYDLDAALSAPDESGKLWLWKNFVDGRPEYWAFDNAYPTYGGGDPMVLGEPCGYAIFKASTARRNDVSEESVIAAIKRAAPKEPPVDDLTITICLCAANVQKAKGAA